MHINVPEIEIADARDAARAMRVLLEAFREDPAVRWIFPEEAGYERHFPRLVHAMGGEAFTLGTAYRMADDSAVALWLPPGVESDADAILQVIEDGVPAMRRDEVLGMAEQMGHHHPEAPHWYLPFIGVHPARQGRGHGSALMRHALETGERSSMLAYLESSNPSNIRLYERMGFEIAGVIRTPTSPPVTPMHRRAVSPTQIQAA